MHKSQGLTFNNIIIDFSGGAFSSGQTYVALSRCTSLEGITLCQPLSERDVIVNQSVVEFSRNFNNQALINATLESSKADNLYKDAIKSFDNRDFRAAVSSFAEAVRLKNVLDLPLTQRFISRKLVQNDDNFPKYDK